MYTTLPHRDRLHALDVLRGNAPRNFRLDASAERLMRLMDVPAREQRKLRLLPRDQDVSESMVERCLTTLSKYFTNLEEDRARCRTASVQPPTVRESIDKTVAVSK